MLAFARASDAVACALALQRAPLAPIRLRIGLNTGEIQLRDEGNYIGPTINRTARLRDLAHGGQTVCPARRRRWCSTTCRPMRGSTISAAIRCATYRARNTLCSCAIPTFPTNFRHCEQLMRLGSKSFRHNSLASWARQADPGRPSVYDGQPIGDVDGCGGSRQDPLGATGCGIDERRHGLVRRPSAGRRTRCAAGSRDSRVGPARSARQVDDGHDSQVHRRASGVDGAGQLRTSPRRECRADRHPLVAVPATDAPDDEPGANRGRR